MKPQHAFTAEQKGRTIAPRTGHPTRVSNALSFCVAAQLWPAYLWLIGARAKASPNADIWDLRRNWPQLRQSLKKQITTGTYLFAPLQRTGHATGPVAELQKVSASGSKPEFAAQETNGCYPDNVGFHTLPQTTPICASE